MSASPERPHFQEDRLVEVAELLLQEKVGKNLKAALGVIEWHKNALKIEGTNLDPIGVFVSTDAKLYDVNQVEGSDQYVVWQYGLKALNAAGRPIAPTMEQYKAEPGSRDGTTHLSLEEEPALPDITLDVFNPGAIKVEGSSVEALEQTAMLQQIGVAAPRR